MIEKIKRHGLSIFIGSTGWFVLILYLFHEYNEYGSIPALISELLEPNPLALMFHIMVLIGPLVSGIIAYLIDERFALQLELNATNEQLQQELSLNNLASEEMVKNENKLLKKVKELEKWQRLTTDRELKMIELKEEIKKLKSKTRQT